MEQQVNIRKKEVNSPDDLNFANSELSLSIIFPSFYLCLVLGVMRKLVKWHQQPLHNVSFFLLSGIRRWNLYVCEKTNSSGKSKGNWKLNWNHNGKKKKIWKIEFPFNRSWYILWYDCYQLLHQQTWKWTQVKMLN